jgi:hypothetical protein
MNSGTRAEGVLQGRPAAPVEDTGQPEAAPLLQQRRGNVREPAAPRRREADGVRRRLRGGNHFGEGAPRRRLVGDEGQRRITVWFVASLS